MAKTEKKLIANNKKAYHDYFILEKYEVGLVLHGTEVKSLRMGKCSIKESFIRVEVRYLLQLQVSLLLPVTQQLRSTAVTVT